MGSASWQPKWWTEENHGSAWTKVKDAMKRDWEQTKADLHVGGRDLDQNVTNTLNQAGGAEPIPPATTPNAPNATGTKRNTDLSWDDAEQPYMYGYGARRQYGAEHPQWNDKLESTLRKDWEEPSAGESIKRQFNDVKDVIKHAYNRAVS